MSLMAETIAASIPHHHPDLAHPAKGKPEWTGDTLGAIDRAAQNGHTGIDQNGQCSLKTHNEKARIGILHWGLAWKDGYTHIWTGKKPGEGRIVKDHRRNVSVGKRPWSELRRLCTPNGKRRIYDARTHMRRCAEAGIMLCLEVKGTHGLEDRAPYRLLMKALIKINAERSHAGKKLLRMYIMTLQNIKGWLQRARAAHAEGFGVALLARGHRPVRWAQYQKELNIQEWDHFTRGLSLPIVLKRQRGVA